MGIKFDCNICELPEALRPAGYCSHKTGETRFEEKAIALYTDLISSTAKKFPQFSDLLFELNFPGELKELKARKIMKALSIIDTEINEFQEKKNAFTT